MSPTTRGYKRFRSINDVYLELCECYDNAYEINEQKVGEILYTEHFFFCNTSELLDKESQMTIKKYNYCKTFNCPPYPSLDETPAKLFEDFMLIENEYKNNTKNLKEQDGSQ